ncbi:MAG: hypothetical protein A3K19_19715 [Lentisphaerae bacterium RIFOXYB12_FULL_65_16]|nr:MAG: hypothetical protein A3K18_31100 [Lentisphaerae bacterium RIFOXYA12_64_32]OGV92089.1 MAG: hypothetical protein A3K19_19715 [Lentisphaerae bacterium RIFOXYB12_FULL_65_16]
MDTLSLQTWLRSACACGNQSTCRKEDANLKAHIEEWVTREKLGFEPGTLGSYPGFVGRNYLQAPTKVLYVGVNPGKYSDTKWEHQRERLRKYHDRVDAKALFDWETDEVWGGSGNRTAKWQALFSGAGLAGWKDVAFTDVCLCPTRDNTPPVPAVVNRCVEEHLVPLARILRPDAVIFLAMKGQEGFFESARMAVAREGIRTAVIPHPTRRGKGETAASIRQAILRVLGRDGEPRTAAQAAGTAPQAASQQTTPSRLPNPAPPKGGGQGATAVSSTPRRLLEADFGLQDRQALTLCGQVPKLARANFIHSCFATAGADIDKHSELIMAAVWRFTDCYLTGDNPSGITKELFHVADGQVERTNVKGYAQRQYFGVWYDPKTYRIHSKNRNLFEAIEGNLDCRYFVHVLAQLNAQVFGRSQGLHMVTGIDLAARFATVRKLAKLD